MLQKQQFISKGCCQCSSFARAVNLQPDDFKQLKNPTTLACILLTDL
ncbi:hypothetical protein B194_3452 [Serratia plymuthica A30]|nr:hypothetical protein B194_3452 [Serratia plymuthica A30]